MLTKEQFYKGSTSIYKRSMFKLFYSHRLSMYEKMTEFSWGEYERLSDIIIKDPDYGFRNTIERTIYLAINVIII